MSREKVLKKASENCDCRTTLDCLLASSAPIESKRRKVHAKLPTRHIRTSHRTEKDLQTTKSKKRFLQFGKNRTYKSVGQSARTLYICILFFFSCCESQTFDLSLKIVYFIVSRARNPHRSYRWCSSSAISEMKQH